MTRRGWERRERGKDRKVEHGETERAEWSKIIIATVILFGAVPTQDSQPTLRGERGVEERGRRRVDRRNEGAESDAFACN